MAGNKKKTAFFCQSCGYESSKWVGQCPACKEWNTMVEEPVRPAGRGSKKGSGAGMYGNKSIKHM